MKYFIKVVVIIFFLGSGGLSFSACNEPKNAFNYTLSSDLEANQEHLNNLKEFEECLSNLYKNRFDAKFTKKYYEQKAEQEVLLDRIRSLQNKKEIILNPLSDSKKYGFGISMTNDQMKAMNQYENDFEKQKVEAAKRLGLDKR